MNNENKFNRIIERLSDEKFLGNRGLSNEVGLHVYCYSPKDERKVMTFFDRLVEDKNQPFHLIKCDLYEILLSIFEDKRILDRIPKQEEQRGKQFLLQQLQKIATPEAFVEHMKYEPHEFGDVLLITGAGAVFPYMRSHKILDNIQHIFSDIPVVMLYPGEYNGNELTLFGQFLDGNYYRAFNLL